ncbi:MAG: homocysteine S-methyltransferase family protein [Anaerolineales bacterium]|nr:homocysteine S-methyltransferase family protein [Anaerolineales bacterium]
MPDFLTRLGNSGVLVADGATGTMLQQAGLPAGAAPERWNLENPDAIIDLHRAYIDAGADIILTNTFGGTRIRLSQDMADPDAVVINRRAAELARQAAGERVIVFGDMGPTGQMLPPLGLQTYKETAEAFAEQAGALEAGGADAILIETMSDLYEAKAALEGAREATSLPVIVSFSFDMHGRTMMGLHPEDAARAMWELEVDVIGANCGRTLTETLTAIEKMRAVIPEAVLLAKPNAGLPHREDGKFVYDVTPEIMGEYALKFADTGVKIFGGCCGSSPAHIKAAADVLKGRNR